MSTIKKYFTIKDLENISGVKAHTIRIWEKRYGLLTPKRTETNIRQYSHENLQKLLNIVLLNNNNYKISKIAEMSGEVIRLNASELAFDQSTLKESIETLKIAMFKFDKTLFNQTYKRLLQEKSFGDVFKEIFIPFLEHIGFLWQTETLFPAHEHFISNLISQKIHINTEKLQYNEMISGKTYVLFLPENETHELGLLYLNYELTLGGHKTIYLGQSLPLNNLNYFFKINEDICFVTSMTIQPYDDMIVAYFNELDAILSKTNHSFIAIGKKAMLVNTHQFESRISLYPTVSKLLSEL